MSQHAYELQPLWDVTNYGLDYIHEVYPESIGCEDKKHKHFKARATEKHASTSLYRGDDNVYRIKDHGDSKKPMNAVDLCMQEENFQKFIEAMQFLYAKYGLSAKTPEIFKPEVTFTETDQPAGWYKIYPAKKITNLEVFAPFLTAETAKEYGLISIESYQKVTKNGKLKTVKATDRYPIFGYKEKDFTKIYEPNAPKKDDFLLKHHFLGSKPQRHIYGWDRIFDNVDIEHIKNLKRKLSETKSSAAREEIQIELDVEMLDSIFIATGGSDGLNLASLGYNVIWLNSESEQISSDEYYKISMVAKTVYNLPDLDKTGIRQAVNIGMKHLELKTIWLPETLNGYALKDMRDWVTKNKNAKLEVVKSMFAKILSQAIEFKFWNWNDKRGTYALDNKVMLYFLKHSGFYLYKIITTTADSTNEIEETRIIHIKDNVVRVVSPRVVKNFVLQWLEQNHIDRAVYNMILKSVYFSENALLSLPEMILDTKTATKDSQIYFFRNKAIKITNEGIQELRYNEVENLVWSANVIQHDFQLQKPHFTIAKDAAENWTIDIHENDSNYFKVLVQTSRMFWEKDVDANGIDTNKFNITSSKLTDEENGIQQLQLINKIYTIGYLLHKYKQKSKAWFVLGMDKKLGNSIKDSNGGSGKTFIVSALDCYLKNWKYKDGKEMPKEDPKFMFDGVTKETDIILMDDLVQNQDYNIIFSKTTGVLIANHKGGKIFTILFEDAAKLVGTTNFVPNDLSGSLKRRLQMYQCSDYYHEKGEDYKETRKISSDFGDRDLFTPEYTKAEWQADYNFMAQCLQFYLSQPEKIDAPEENLIIRNLQQIVGDVQLQHCNEFFKDGSMLNKWFPRQEIQDEYNAEAGKFGKTPNSHKKGMEAYCKMNGWLLESKKMAIANQDAHSRKSVEHYFINTSGQPVLTPAMPTEVQSEMDFYEQTFGNDNLNTDADI